MFQNIAEEEKISNSVVEENLENKINAKAVLKKLFTKQNIFVYIISFMLSTVSTINGIAPFGLAIFAAVLSNGLPAMCVFIMALIRDFNWDRWRRKLKFYSNCSCFCRIGFNF